MNLLRVPEQEGGGGGGSLSQSPHFCSPEKVKMLLGRGGSSLERTGVGFRARREGSSPAGQALGPPTSGLQGRSRGDSVGTRDFFFVIRAAVPHPHKHPHCSSFPHLLGKLPPGAGVPLDLSPRERRLPEDPGLVQTPPLVHSDLLTITPSPRQEREAQLLAPA